MHQVSPQLASDGFAFASAFCDAEDILLFQLQKNDSIAIITFFVICYCLRSYIFIP